MRFQAANSGTSLLHYAEEQARKEVELASLKKQKQQLETALRQLQDKHSSTNEKHAEEIEALEEEVKRWQRNRWVTSLKIKDVVVYCKCNRV